MEQATYTLTLQQTEQFRFEVTVPEIGITVSGATLDSAVLEAHRAIVKHHTTCYLILVFADQHFDEQGWYLEPRKRLTGQELVAFSDLASLGIKPGAVESERHLIFRLEQPLTLEQAKWLDENTGKLFDRYFTKDETEVSNYP